MTVWCIPFTIKWSHNVYIHCLMVISLLKIMLNGTKFTEVYDNLCGVKKDV